jgi:CheY-like chemotaxis protein
MEAFKILMVDDDPEDRAIIQEAMDSIDAGEIIHFAEHGEQALEILEQGVLMDRLPCIVVLDLNMPRLNGTETLRLIRANDHLKDISVIIYSTSINPLEKEKCMRLGANDYITKPLSYKESTFTARKLLDLCTAHTPS